jgi:hypothetical protein
MVKAKKSMFPGKKKFDMNQVALKIIMNNIDAFSEAIGFPSNVIRQQTKYENALFDNHEGDLDSYKSMLRTNRTASPTARYIKKWVKSNKKNAIGFLQAKNKYQYKSD